MVLALTASDHSLDLWVSGLLAPFPNHHRRPRRVHACPRRLEAIDRNAPGSRPRTRQLHRLLRGPRGRATAARRNSSVRARARMRNRLPPRNRCDNDTATSARPTRPSSVVAPPGYLGVVTRADQAGFIHEHDGPDAVAPPELHQYPGDMRLDGRPADDQVGSDLAVGFAGREQPEQLESSRGSACRAQVQQRRGLAMH
jgi:hypothetical protein